MTRVLRNSLTHHLVRKSTGVELLLRAWLTLDYLLSIHVLVGFGVATMALVFEAV